MCGQVGGVLVPGVVKSWKNYKLCGQHVLNAYLLALGGKHAFQALLPLILATFLFWGIHTISGPECVWGVSKARMQHAYCAMGFGKFRAFVNMLVPCTEQCTPKLVETAHIVITTLVAVFVEREFATDIDARCLVWMWHVRV